MLSSKVSLTIWAVSSCVLLCIVRAYTLNTSCICPSFFLADHLNFAEFKNYEALCRNEDIIPYKYAHLLTCRYYVPHPAYLIGPVKEEVMHLHPRIVVWHKILHPSEMARFKELAYPRVSRKSRNNVTTVSLTSFVWYIRPFTCSFSNPICLCLMPLVGT